MPIPERKDRIKDTSTTTGTGSFTLSGSAPTGFRSFSAGHTSGAVVHYVIDNGAEWEVGRGTWTNGTSTLTRDAVFASSNAGALVNFTAGTKAVYSTPTAADMDSKLDKTPALTSKSADYTFVLADAGGEFLHPSADTTARTLTVPANGSVAYEIGTTLTIFNQNGAGVITIAITTDTMRWAGTTLTGSRSLAANGIATIKKLTSTEWIISGVGLT